MNFNEIITKLKTTADAHINVAYTDAGVLESLNWGENRYPLVMFICQPSRFEINKIRYRISMVCADVIDDRYLQQITKQSNMFDVGTDILTKLINDSQTAQYDIDETSIAFQPFVDSFPDLCAGFQFDFDMTTIYNKDCNLPFV
jgi:hypothetical protein